MARIANSKASAQGIVRPKLKGFQRPKFYQAVQTMKLTTILLFAFSMQVCAETFGQNITLSVKDAPLEAVFKEIKRQTGYVFFYRTKWLEGTKNVTVEAVNWSLVNVLETCFKSQPITYSISERIITIKPKVENFQFPSDTIPRVRIVGKVELVDTSYTTLENVNIINLNTKAGAVSGLNGEFSIIAGKEDVLEFTLVGTRRKKVTVSNTNEPLIVRLARDVKEQEAVTVYNTGFQSIPKERATGSFVTISNKQFERRVSSDILSRLEGVTSGLLINGNQDNSLDNVSIRGRSTIFANAQPLIILDNFPYTGDLNTINPNDIESITVLKDAAAASMWGAYSGNGVIVITRKRGKYNQGVKFNVNTNLTVKSKPDLFYDKAYLNATDFIDIELGLFNSGFYDGDLNNVFTMPAVSGVVEILAQQRAGSISDEEATSKINALRNNDVRMEYDKYLYRNAVDQQYSVNVSGGGNRANYYLSGGYIRDVSNIVRNHSERYTFNSSMTFRPFNNLEITGGMLYTQGVNYDNGFGNVVSGGKAAVTPYTLLADENGNPLPVVTSLRQSFVENPPVTGLLNWQYVPLDELKLNDNKTRFFNNVLNFGVKYNILRGLSAEIKFQYLKGNSQQRRLYSPESYTVRDLVNRFSTIAANQVVGRIVPHGGILTNINTNNYSSAGRFQINYSHDFKRDKLVLLAGIDVSEHKTEGNISTAYGYDDLNGSQVILNYDMDYLTYPTGSAKIPFASPYTPYKLNRRRSFFGNAAYTVLDKYTISSSARLDQANIFGVKTNQKGRPFWSAGLAWDIFKEDFFKVSWLPFLKFRATYGYNGNYSNTNTAYTTGSMVSTGGLNPTPITYLNSAGNPQLKWEKIGIINLAMDFQIGNNVLSGTVEYFHKNGVDMIGVAPIPSSTGSATASGNYSNMKGRGIDVTLNKSVHFGDVNWTTSLLISYSKDEITKMAPITGMLTGKPVSAVYSFLFGGLDENGDPLGYIDDQLSKDYSLIIEKGSTNLETKMYNGPGTPVLFGGITTEISWRGFAASAVFRYKTGYYFQKNTIRYSSLYNDWQGHSDYYKRWLKPGDEAVTDVPAMVGPDYPDFILRDAFFAESEANIVSGDHIRLQDFRLQYSFENSRKLTYILRNVQVYFYANNLGIIWKRNKFGIDPDAPFGYTNPKTYSFGLKAGF